MKKYKIKSIKSYFMNDKRQIEVLNSTKKRIMVEAPPGYGKTKLLIGKTLHDLLHNVPKNHEKVLMLTFSVNSASKMRDDIHHELSKYPIGLKSKLQRKTMITNFHGFARSILSKHGTLLSPNLVELNDFMIVNENEINNIRYAHVLRDFSSAVVNVKKDYIDANLKGYNHVIIDKLIPTKRLTYNAILTLTLQLLKKHPQILRFYQRLYTKIVIDEFQDINYLNLKLLKLFLHYKVNVEVYGDPLQRIYGFIGTIPNIFDYVGGKYDFSNYKLETNYRFKDNRDLLNLESRIRKVASDVSLVGDRLPELYLNQLNIYDTQEQEVEAIIETIKAIPDTQQLAILTAQRGGNVNLLIDTLNKQQINFFNALPIYSNGETYKRFCDYCSISFQQYFGVEKETRILTDKLKHWFVRILKEFKGNNPELSSLLKVLRASLNYIVSTSSYRRKTKGEKYDFFLAVFKEYRLIDYISAIDSKVQVLTIHTAKGLEWDNVLLMDIEQDQIPSYRGLCENCGFRSNCLIELNAGNENEFLEYLSIFYVAVTRAKKDLYMTLSKRNDFGRNVNKSCILNVLKLRFNIS